MKKQNNKLLKWHGGFYALRYTFLLLFILGFEALRSNCTSEIITDFQVIFEAGYSIKEGGNKYAYSLSNDPKVKVKLTSSCSEKITLFIHAIVASGTGFNLCYTSYSFTPKDGEVNLSLPIAPYITKYDFTWNWTVTAIPNCTSTSGYVSNSITKTTDQQIYVTFARPVAPMSQVWASVLDYACVWASRQTSSSGVMQKVVEGLYNNTGFLYDVYSGAPRYTSYSTHSFNLTKMLSEIGSGNIVVNCYDMGKAVTIFANALGCSSSYAFTNPFGYLNCIKAIGRGWSNNPFYASNGTSPIMGEDDDYYDGRTGFGNHAFCMLSSTVYDACMKIDTDSNPDAAPHIESWASGWNWTTYKSKVIDNNPASSPGTPYTGYSFAVY